LKLVPNAETCQPVKSSIKNTDEEPSDQSSNHARTIQRDSTKGGGAQDEEYGGISYSTM
jgi:hypothetical protein